MAISMLLRRQSGCSLPALISLIHSNQPLSASVLRNAHFLANQNELTSVYKISFKEARNTNYRLNFQSSFASQASSFAFEDYSDDDKTKGYEGPEISRLNIHHNIVSRLSCRGITKLFPIQQAVLEYAMQGRDMIGRAKTGTGKTLAFGIPILDKITRHNENIGPGRDPLALVLAPTRELARQVGKDLSESSMLDTLCVYGGTPIGKQMSYLSRGVDVVVGTPGRVIDLLKRRALNLSSVQFVVLDEADEMLNVGFEESVEVILQMLPQNRQTLMFSATMPDRIRDITRKYMKNPLMIDLVGDSKQKLAEGITLYSVLVDQCSKAGVVGPLVTEHANGGKCIVFTQTKRDADQLAIALGSRNYKCEALHGNIVQTQREITLKRFRDGDLNILVATDVAARGLDIPNVDLIIHYELPKISEIFVHRSGRTGRAGKKGIVITLYSMDQQSDVQTIEHDVGCKFQELPPVASDGTEMLMIMGGHSCFGFGLHLQRLGKSGIGVLGGYASNKAGRFGGYGNLKSGSGGGYAPTVSRYFGRSDSGFSSGGGFGDFGSNVVGNMNSAHSNQSGSGSGNAKSILFGCFGDERF